MPASDNPSPEQLKVLFKKVFGPMQPPPEKQSTADRIRGMRRFLRAELRRGLRLEQLCAGLATDDFKIKITPTNLRRLLNEKPHPKTDAGAMAATAARPAANAVPVPNAAALARPAVPAPSPKTAR